MVLPRNFVNRWKKKETQPSLTERIKNVANPPGDLKQQITGVGRQIDVQVHKLDNACKRFEKRDAALFKRVIKALSQRDTARANILASELAEIRKVEKMLMHAKLALESVSMRLTTVSELGDVVTALAPAANVLNSVRSEMSGIFPEANRELENIGGLLGEIVTSTTQTSGLAVNAEAANAEAEKILEEAERVAEERIKQQLPDVTSEVTSQRRALKT
jgi:division protein CdvB (Snf7/Vps24/ESCRT-III family)